MKNILIFFLPLFFLLFFLFGKVETAYAAGQSEPSGKLATQAILLSPTPRVNEIQACTNQLETFLQKQGPKLAPYAHSFAQEADINGLDCTLVVAISGQESAFGRLPSAPYNAWGWCGIPACGFSSWEEAIRTVSQTLGDKYCKRWNACDPATIGPHYAADPNWPYKVSHFMKKIKATKVKATAKMSLTI